MELRFSFALGWRRFCDRLGSRSTEVWSILSINIRRISRNVYRDRPVVSEIKLIGRDDSPSLMGSSEQESGT